MEADTRSVSDAPPFKVVSMRIAQSITIITIPRFQSWPPVVFTTWLGT